MPSQGPARAATTRSDPSKVRNGDTSYSPQAIVQRTFAAVCLLVALCLGSAACEHETPASASSSPKPAARPAQVETPPAAQPALPASAPPTPKTFKIDGRWSLRSGQHDYTLNLVATDQGLRGYVQGPGGAPMPIKIGVYSGDAFLFETTGGDAGWLWSGHILPDGLKGQRENVQTGEVVSFTAQRSE